MNAQAGLGGARARRSGQPFGSSFGPAVTIAAALTVVLTLGVAAPAARAQVTGPVFVDGMAQPVFLHQPVHVDPP